MSINNPVVDRRVKNSNNSTWLSQPHALNETSEHYQKKLLQNSIREEEYLKKKLAIYNGLADGKIQAICSIINLFLLLLIETLGGAVYNGPKTNAPYILGWISVSQVILAYILVVIVKFCIIPKIQEVLFQIQDSIKGLKLRQDISEGRKQLKDFSYDQTYLFHKTKNIDASQHSHTNFTEAEHHEAIIRENSNIFQLQHFQQNYHPNKNLQILIQKQNNAQRWKNFWQIFVVGKTFSIPGVALLLLIITPLTVASIARTSIATHNAQGWISVGIWAFFIAVFILIRFIFWNAMNEKVLRMKSQPFKLFYLVSNGRKELSTYNLSQLEDLQKILQTRASQFSKCFQAINKNQLLKKVKDFINQKSPKRDLKVEQNIQKLIALQNSSKNVYSFWLNFFSARMVSTIINSLKFLIVMAITFVPNYSQTPQSLLAARQAIGSIGIICYVLGYVFYFAVKCCLLPHLEGKANYLRSEAFTTYKLVYFGNKKLNDLQVHELQNILQIISQRKQQFQQCFPNADITHLKTESQRIIGVKINECEKYEPVSEYLRKYIEAHNTVKFLRVYQDTPLMQSVYSTYVLLVLLILTAASPSTQALYILGYYGVAVLAFLIIIQLIFRYWVVPHFQSNQQFLKIDGWSQYYLFYNKQIKIENVEIKNLLIIESSIQQNPIQFKKCFPKTKNNSVLNQIKQIIFKKQKLLPAKRSVKNQQEYRVLQLKLQRAQKKLKNWSSFMNDILYPLTPVLIVIFIFWAQTIGSSLYGRTVCGFLTIAILSIVILMILLYNLCYKHHLKNQIKSIKQRIHQIEQRQNNKLNKQHITSQI